MILFSCLSSYFLYLPTGCFIYCSALKNDLSASLKGNLRTDVVNQMVTGGRQVGEGRWTHLPWNENVTEHFDSYSISNLTQVQIIYSDNDIFLDIFGPFRPYAYNDYVLKTEVKQHQAILTPGRPCVGRKPFH